MKTAVIGSRKFTDKALLGSTLSEIKPSEILSGGAKGADSIAEAYADTNGIPKKIFLPKFKTDPNTPYHARWYLERNKQIVDAADMVVAFWDGKSKGTSFTIEYAKERGKPVKIIQFTP